MAVLNIRVDDAVRDQLKELADVEGVTLSENVRDLLLEVIVPVHEQESRHGDEPAPESMRIIDRKVLSMLHRILARVLPEDANDVDGDIEYQLDRAKVLEPGGRRGRGLGHGGIWNAFGANARRRVGRGVRSSVRWCWCAGSCSAAARHRTSVPRQWAGSRAR